ncbi:MAG TPA: cytochrome c oxidase subunit 3 [Micavibrio sp.]
MSDKIEYGTTGKPHPYHIVRPSIWPMAGAFAAALLAAGMVMFMHKVTGVWGIIPGLASVAAVMFFWWKDIIHESVVERIHTKIAEIGLRYGMALFIASEVMFFVAFFWAFFDASIYAGQENMPARLEYTKGVWPPLGTHVIPPFDLPLLMTMILLLSGCTVTWAHHALLQGDNKNTIKALGITVALGFIFLCFQVYEYMHAHFGFTEGIYPSTFFMATGFHGFHVFVGTVFLFVCWRRAIKGHFTPERHLGFEAAAWYWHFVDVVWLFLFVAIYWWGGTIGTGTALPH